MKLHDAKHYPIPQSTFNIVRPGFDVECLRPGGGGGVDPNLAESDSDSGLKKSDSDQSILENVWLESKALSIYANHCRTSCGGNKKVEQSEILTPSAATLGSRAR